MQTNPYGISAIWHQGDPIILGVALLLLLMSIATWTVILWRALALLGTRRANRASQRFWHAHSLEEGLQLLRESQAENPFYTLAQEGRSALEHHRTHTDDLHGHLPLAEWLNTSLRGAIDTSAERLQRGLSILASVGSTAPFIGLFGTVWGIYHALVAIGTSGQASIDRIAGPVGEALIMTAFGLAVAIPAVLGYNALTRANRRVLGHLHRFAHQLQAYYLTGTPITSPHGARPTHSAEEAA